MRIAIFGLGYVGTVTAAGLASRGHQVHGVDVDAVKVDLIRSGRSPVVEPGIDELIATAVERGDLSATTDPVVALDRAEVSLLCVGTPSKHQGGTDLSYLRRALDDIRRGLGVATPPASGFHAVVVRSTVPPGTGDDVVSASFAGVAPAPGWAVGTAMCPEFLREGSGVADFFNPPFVVLGTADQRVIDLLSEMFSFLNREIRLVDVRSAEALKYACNAFHAVKITFANEIGRIAQAMNVDSHAVMELVRRDTRLNIAPAYLRPGFAFGGSCLPKDLRALMYMAKTRDVEIPMLGSLLGSNRLHIERAAELVLARGGRRVGLIGLSFKAGTDDLRESPLVTLAEILIGKGLELSIYDPHVNVSVLMGANKRYIDQHVPHVAALLKEDCADVIRGAQTIVVGALLADAMEALKSLATPEQYILDLAGMRGGQQLPAEYQGVCW